MKEGFTLPSPMWRRTKEAGLNVSGSVTYVLFFMHNDELRLRSTFRRRAEQLLAFVVYKL